MGEFLTPAEVAAELKVKPRTIVKWLNEKRLQGIKLGTGRAAEWRIDRDDLDKYLNSLKRGGE